MIRQLQARTSQLPVLSQNLRHPTRHRPMALAMPLKSTPPLQLAQLHG